MEHQNAVITLCYSSLYWKADGHDAALHGLSYMYVTAILSQNSRRGLVALHGTFWKGQMVCRSSIILWYLPLM